MHIKFDTEYILKTGHTINAYGGIPLEMKAELVRCKECKYHIDNRCYASNLTKYGNVRLGALTGDDYFCADGERKEK